MSSDACTRQAAVLHTALQRQAAGSKCKDLAAHYAIVEDLLGAQVCVRCILRVLRHTTWEDYLELVQPSHEELLLSLRQAAGQQGPGKFAAHPADTTTAAQPSDGRSAEPCERVAAANGTPLSDQAGCAASGPGVELSHNVAEPTTNGSAMPLFNDKDASSKSVQPFIPCTLCLGLLQRIQGKQALTDLPDAATPTAGPFICRAVPWLSPEALSQVLTDACIDFSTFAIELSLPLSVMLRDRVLAEHLSAQYGWMGLYKGNSDQFLSLKMVLRRVLGPLMVQHLGADKKLLDGGTDLTLSLVLEHPQGMLEVRPLLEDHVAFQQQKRERSQPHLSNRQRKKLRRIAYEAASAGGAAMPGEPEDQGQGGAQLQVAATQDIEEAGTGLRQEAAESLTTAEEQADSLQAATDALLSSIGFDKALGQVQSVPSRVFRSLFPWPLKPLGQDHLDTCIVSVRLTRASVYLAGRYLKLQRGMPQSRWYDPQTGQRIGYVSVAERIEEAVLPLYAADESKFIAGGREDADVRMLGEGRPFVLELINPQIVNPSKADLACVEQEMAKANHGARVVQLATCTRKAIDKIKEAEESKEKTYAAVCWAERALTPEDVVKLLAAKNLTIMQDTPLRVLHRRAPKVRDKVVSVEAVEVVAEKPQYFSIKLRTQAGAYVKEFCHGDLGRTQPNLGTLLGCRTEILQLDVAEVHMPDWP